MKGDLSLENNRTKICYDIFDINNSKFFLQKDINHSPETQLRSKRKEYLNFLA